MCMSDSRTKFGFGFWAILALSMALIYPLSFGPACWISQRTGATGAVVSFVYQPALQLAHRGPEFVSTPVLRYAQWGMEPSCYSAFSQDEVTGYCHWEPAMDIGCIF
jgi:hypothetical protein